MAIVRVYWRYRCMDLLAALLSARSSRLGRASQVVAEMAAVAFRRGRRPLQEVSHRHIQVDLATQPLRHQLSQEADAFEDEGELPNCGDFIDPAVWAGLRSRLMNRVVDATEGDDLCGFHLAEILGEEDEALVVPDRLRPRPVELDPEEHLLPARLRPQVVLGLHNAGIAGLDERNRCRGMEHDRLVLAPQEWIDEHRLRALGYRILAVRGSHEVWIVRASRWMPLGVFRQFLRDVDVLPREA